MKSIYLLCEYGISISTIEVLLKNNISIDDIANRHRKLNTIFGGNSLKKMKIIRAVQQIINKDKANSVYELTQYGLSKTIADKLFELNVMIDNIDENSLLNYRIGKVTCSKILNAYKLWEKETRYEVMINENIITNIIYKYFNHNQFSLEKLIEILEKNRYSTYNLNEILDNIGIIKKASYCFGITI